jgi:lysophospholipase L1-like esterase
LYLPAKRRVLDGRLRFDDGSHPKFADWIPGTLPQEVAALAASRGIRVVDATPALFGHARAGRLPYNSILDTHLNALGSRAVGETLAEAIDAR